MRKTIIIPLLILSSFNAFSQYIKVQDAETSLPVENAVVKNTSGNTGTVTNIYGNFDLSEFSPTDTLRFLHASYEPATATVEMLQQSSRFLMTAKTIHLEEIVLSADRSYELSARIPYSIEIIKRENIIRKNPQTSADMLAQTGNVFVQKSQMGGGSPVLRGFEANRILLVVDGIRMNNAIYRSGHLQDVITIDNAIIERAEVIFGPASVMYGSDALGGAVCFKTKDPVLNDKKELDITLNSDFRYSSANQERTVNINLNAGSKKFGMLSALSISNFGNLRTGRVRNPFYEDFGKCLYEVGHINKTDSTSGRDTIIGNNDPSIQLNSSYSQAGFMQKFVYAPNDSMRHLINFQFSTSSNINRYDRLQETDKNNKPVYAEWYYGPQKRILAAYSFEQKKKTLLYDKLNCIGAYQYVIQERNDRKLDKLYRNHQQEEVHIASLNADAVKFLSQKHQINYGVEATMNNVISAAQRFQTDADLIEPYQTRYPDGGSIMSTAAAYVSHKWDITPKLLLTEGVRYSNIRLQSDFDDTSFFNFPYKEIRQNNNAINENLGIIFRPDKTWKISLLGSTGFRAPNVDDAGKVFESQSGVLVVPNPNLKPEYAYNAELSVRKTVLESLLFEVSGYYTYLDGAIVLRHDKYSGSDSTLFNGTLSAVRSLQNADKAYIYGFNARLNASLNKYLSIYSTINYTYGRYFDTEFDTTLPLDHIPPVFGQTGLHGKYKRFESDIYSIYNGWKHLKDYKPDGEDNLKYATPNGMPSWYTLNLNISYYFSRYIIITAAAENIFDVHYRVFASGISAPGRNIVISLRTIF